jgi:hypothetical protein
LIVQIADDGRDGEGVVEEMSKMLGEAAVAAPSTIVADRRNQQNGADRCGEIAPWRA